MKNRSPIFLFTILFLVSCDLCRKDEYYEQSDFIQNNSGHNVSVVVEYEKSKPKDSLVINNGDIVKLNGHINGVGYNEVVSIYFYDLPAIKPKERNFLMRNTTVVNNYFVLNVFSIREEHYKMALENGKDENK